MQEQEIRDLARKLAATRVEVGVAVVTKPPEEYAAALEHWTDVLLAIDRRGFSVIPTTRLDSMDRYARYDPDIAFPAGGHTYPEEAIMEALDEAREELAMRED